MSNNQINKLVKVGNLEVALQVSEFDFSRIDFEKVLKIDFSQLLAEVCTISLLMNRVGVLLAEANKELALAKLNKEIEEAKIRKKIKRRMISADEKPTVQGVEDALLMDSDYKKINEDYLMYVEGFEQLTSIYWSIKSKDEKLNKLSLTLEKGARISKNTTVNGVLIEKSRTEEI